jgi:hypothetical protein
MQSHWTLLLLALFASETKPAVTGFENFLYTSASDLQSIQRQMLRSDIAGVQIVYSWKQLEPEKGKYDFSQIENDLAFMNQHQKKMFLQIQDRFFSPEAKYVPQYLMTDPAYTGGLVPQKDNPGEGVPQASGWAAEQWNPEVRKRYQALLQALAKRFDGKIYGINLPETAVDIDTKHDKTGFTCGKYFEGEMENLTFAKHVFMQSYVLQYVNFWPCEWNNDHGYMQRAFDLAVKIGAGLGGPDVVPYRKGQMDNSYPFFSRYKDRLSMVAMAVQEPTLTYRNPKTRKRFTRQEFESFGRNYLGARIIFWSASSPWLN